MTIKKLLAGTALTLALLAGGAQAQQAQEERPRSLDELLRLVEQGRARDSQEAAQREREFQQQQAEQDRLLREATERRTAEEARSEQLETTFEENELLIGEVRGQLDARLGSLRELFGVLQQVSGDARGQFEASLTNVEFPDRGQFLTDFAAAAPGRFLPICAILKRELLRIPFFGWGLATLRPIAIDRKNPIQALKDVKSKGLARLKEGNNLLIFPEGTRSPHDDMLPFRDGAFRLAIEEGVPVLPLVVAGTRDAMAKHSFVFNRARAEVRVLEPVDTTGMTPDQAGALREQVKGRIARARAELRQELSAID